MEKEVLSSTKRVVEASKHVCINHKAIQAIASRWKKEQWQLPGQKSSFHFFDGSERTLTYLFLIDSLNFSFWTPKKVQAYQRPYQGKNITGSSAIALSLKQAFLRKHPIETTDYLLSIRKRDLLKILGGKGELPLLKKRLHILHQNALILKKNFYGKFAHVVEKTGGDAIKLVMLLVNHFPSFNDAVKKNGTIKFYKRAQLLAQDIHTAFRGKGLGKLTNMDKLTAFADYKLPQVLRHWGILEYEKALAKTIDAGIQLKRGSLEEIEIRANTIWAVEYLKEALAKKGINIQSREIDWFLWKRAKEEKGMKPYHKVRSIFY